MINYNGWDDRDKNTNLHNGDVSSGIGLLNLHTLPQYKKSSNLNETNMAVENGDVNGGHCYINSPTGYYSNNHNFIDSTTKRDEISPNISEMENNG